MTVGAGWSGNNGVGNIYGVGIWETFIIGSSHEWTFTNWLYRTGLAQYNPQTLTGVTDPSLSGHINVTTKFGGLARLDHPDTASVGELGYIYNV